MSARELSSRRVRLWLLWPTGHSRWHHFHDLLAAWLVDRDDEIDRRLGLVELERRYAATYLGVEHGMPLDEALRRLDAPFVEYMGQSESYRNLYFPAHELEVVVQAGVVKYVVRGKPGWVGTGGQ